MRLKNHFCHKDAARHFISTFFFVLFVITGFAAAGPAVKIICKPYPKKVIADGVTLSRVLAQISDSDGQRVTGATHTVTFQLSGTGTLSGENPVQAVDGQAIINVIAPSSAGSCTVTAASPGLTGDSVTIEWVPPRLPQVDHFPLGMFENHPWIGSYFQFSQSIDDLKAHNLDGIMVVNGSADNCGHILSAGENKGFDIYLSPAGTLEQTWWPSSVAANSGNALAAAGQIVDAWSSYNCLKLYYTTDEPGLDRLTKLGLLTDAFYQLDPARPSAPVLIGIDRVGPHLNESQPPVLIIDVYPCAWGSSIGDFTMNGYGYSHLDFVSYTRTVVEEQPAQTPIWFILQAHSFGSGQSFSLRQPELEEMRRMFWTAIGEGAKGIFWFIYSTSSDPSQGWLGLKDPARADDYDEVADLAGRVIPLKTTLLQTQKAPDACFVTGGGTPYVSTLMKNTGDTFYAVVINQDCVNSQALTLQSGRFDRIKDLESGMIYALDTPLSYRPGDGRIFELQDSSDDPPEPPENLTVSESTETRITLQWNPPAAGGTPLGYHVYYQDGTFIDTTTEITFTDTGLTPDAAYCYKVQSYNDTASSSYSAPACGQTFDLQLPTAPSLLKITAKSAVDVQMQWQPASDNVGIGSYKVFRNDIEIALVPDCTFTDTDVQADTVYWYHVTAVDVDGNQSTQASNRACARTNALLALDGLVGHWPLDSGQGSVAPDSSANNNDGTIAGSGWAWADGRYGSALSFSGGSGDKIDLGALDVTDSSEMTIAAWIYANGFKPGGQDNRIVSKSTGTSTASHYWMLGTYNSGGVKLRFMLKADGVSDALVASDGVIGLGAWVHAAAVYDGQDMILYKDGAEVGRMAKSGTVDFDPLVPAYIGSNAYDYGTWNGRIDDVRIYDRALVPSEIQEVMNNIQPDLEPCQWQVDLNCDCVVNLLDMWILSGNWLTGQAISEGNINEDMTVDFSDFASFSGEWYLPDD